MPSIVKKLMAEEYRRCFRESRNFFVANMSGITGLDENALRLEAGKSGVDIEMLKNKVVRRVLREEGLDGLADIVEGQVVLFIGEDPLKTAKVVMDARQFTKKKLVVKGGWMDGKVLSAKDTVTLANIPAIEVLYSMVVGAVQTPLKLLVQVLNGLPRKLVIVLNKAAEKSQEASTPSQATAEKTEETPDDAGE